MTITFLSLTVLLVRLSSAISRASSESSCGFVKWGRTRDEVLAGQIGRAPWDLLTKVRRLEEAATMVRPLDMGCIALVAMMQATGATLLAPIELTVCEFDRACRDLRRLL